MADEVTVKIRGTRELSTGMRRLSSNVDDAAVRAFASAADQSATMVRARVPRGPTGRLAGSVHGDPGDHGGSVAMGAGVPYAGWIEFGGGHGRPYVSAGRYLYPTANAAGPELQRAGEDAVRHEIGRMAWPTPTNL